MELAREPLREHLAELYADQPLCIYRDDNGKSLSTVSQPSLVLYMIDLLDLQPGLSVFELGGGSGWNAAMMGRLVGPTGKVKSIEILECVVPAAKATLSELGLTQVEFLSGDASQVVAADSETQFDRGVFTASAWDLPSCLFEKIKDRGLLLFVFKAQPNYDLLCLLRKTDQDSFTSELHFSCSFVPVTGQNAQPEHQPISVDSLEGLSLSQELNWTYIKISNTAISEFIEFAKLVFDSQQTYLLPNPEIDFDEEFWGLEGSDSSSLLIFNEDRLLLYGDESSLIALRRAAKRWQKVGQPGIDDLKLSIHSSKNIPEPTNDQWIVRRGDSIVLWGL